MTQGCLLGRAQLGCPCQKTFGGAVAGPLSGSPVAGSTGRAGGAGIPAAGIPPEAAAQLRRTSRGWPEARLRIVAEEAPAQTRTLIFDMPGRTEDYIVLCAHVDGHDLAESAMDNATGVAAALAVARALRGEVGGWRRGLRVAVFSVEEWALTGSARYVEALTEAERDRIALNVNLDSIAGSANLTALTSGFPALEPFLLAVAEASGQPLRTVRPLMTNSDHANFALAGIPAFRLVAGYDEPGANLRLVLTNQDTRDKVIETDLLRATELTAMIVAAACDAPAEVAARWRRRSTNAT